MPTLTTSITGPATFGTAAAVTPNDGADLPVEATALFIAVAGTLSVVNNEGTTLTTTGSLTAGTVVPFRVKRVRSSGTSAVVYALY